MKKSAGLTLSIVGCAAAASLGFADTDLDCDQLLVPKDRAMLGIEYAQEAEGLRVKAVVPEGPAQRAGLAAGDLIVEINGDALLFRDRVEAVKWLNRYRAGQALNVAVHRDGVTKSVELRGERITCEAAKRLEKLLRNAKSGTLKGCSHGERSATNEPEDHSHERSSAFLEKFPAEGAVIVLTAVSGGSTVRIETDVALRGEPLEVGELPGFMREMSDRLRDGESISFRVWPQSATGESPRIEVLSPPEHVIRPSVEPPE